MTQILTHIVIDASIVLSWILDDEQDPDALFAQEYIIRGGIIMCAPDLLVTEVTNALLSAVKSRRISAENAHNLLTNFVRMPVDYSPIGITFSNEILDFCQRTGLTAYDGLYLYIAKIKHIPIATLDRQIRTVCSQEGVILLNRENLSKIL